MFGANNANLLRIAAKSGVELMSRGAELTLRSPEAQGVELVANLFVQVYCLLKAGHPIFPQDMEHAFSMLAQDPRTDLSSLFRDAVFVTSPKKNVVPKTLNQREYVAAMRQKDMVFAIGPAGTGKTYLAVAMALACLTTRRVKRLILTRPAVEAGERLGFLPGDLAEKINPYLRPLYDALHEMLDYCRVREMLENGVIEVAPLAFMRGRTLNDSFIILDEAQNTTPEQMKMFLTRLGFGSKAVITGDVTQIDLPLDHRAQPAMRSGLVQAAEILSEVQEVSILRFHETDVIRHPLVGKIVQAYERYEDCGGRCR